MVFDNFNIQKQHIFGVKFLSLFNLSKHDCVLGNKRLLVLHQKRRQVQKYKILSRTGSFMPFGFHQLL